MNNRVNLLDPNLKGASIRIERYMLGIAQLPDVEGETVTRFEAKPSIAFRPERLIYAAGMPMSPWQRFLLKWLGWIALPWFRVETYDPSDELTEEEIDAMKDDELEALEENKKRLRFRWYRPTFELIQRSMQCAQARALAGVIIKSISVDGTELLVHEVPLETFSAFGIGARFMAPTCMSDRPIRIVTSKTTVPIMFSMQGAGASV